MASLGLNELRAISSILPINELPRTALHIATVCAPNQHILNFAYKNKINNPLFWLKKCVPHSWHCAPPRNFVHLPDFIFWLHPCVNHVKQTIGKTFGPLPDRRTGNHMENPSFIGPLKLLQDLIFSTLRVLFREAPYRIFFPDRRTGAIRVFTGPPPFSLVEDRGLVDFPMSGQTL